MASFQLISAYDAQQRLAKEKIQLVDIRDKKSFASDHIEGAFHLSNDSLAQFMTMVELDTPVFVICYHGNSSKGVAHYLSEQGYVDVYSVEGGFAGWQLTETAK